MHGICGRLEKHMDFVFFALAAGLLIYLIAALLNPENFS